MEGIQKSSPLFEKGRTGGIYEPPFQKTKLIRLVFLGFRYFKNYSLRALRLCGESIFSKGKAWTTSNLNGRW